MVTIQRTIRATDLKFSAADVQQLSERLGDAAWYAAERQQAWELYQRTPIPTTKDEAWRRTDIRGLRWSEIIPASLANNASDGSSTPSELLQPLAGQANAGQIVIEGGHVVKTELDPTLAAQGVIFTDFLTATREHADLIQQYLGSAVKPSEGKFALLATAFADQGIFVYIPENVTVELPLHSVLWANGRNHFSRVLVVAAAGAQLTYVHELSSPIGGEQVGSLPANNQQATHVGTVEVLCGAGANVKFIELQSLGQHFWHFAHERCQIAADGKLDWIFTALGTKLTKNFAELDLNGRGAWGRMSGFYFAENHQLLDHDTQQNHLAPDTTSDLLFKGALVDHSRSVWQGMIYVAPGAQKTDGFQANRNLILSPHARADSIPGLEIMANDVRCTHAATAGQLEPTHMFYLMARGIPESDARRLIVEGFYDPILQRIPFEGVRDRLLAFIDAKMA
jgi:Fe-S cluster assembly protein SufD